MTERTLRRLDTLSAALLLLWAGMALGLACLQVPATFRVLDNRDLAGQVVSAALRRLDWAAWAAFVLSPGLSWGSRWLAEFREEGIGPLRLWSAAALAALFMCFASSFIVTPRLEAIRARAGLPLGSLPEEHADRAAFEKAHGLSMQLLGLRVLLALGLAAGAARLPGRKEGGAEG